MPISKRQLIGGVASLLLAAPAARANWLAAGASTQTIGGPAFGAGWLAKFDRNVDPMLIRSALQTIISAVDASMSPFRPDSEIARFNASSSTEWMQLSGPVGRVLGIALEVAKASDGAFDPTVGGLVGRYGFGPITRIARGTHQEIQLRAGALRKADGSMTLDLCGIAKGYALDQMVACLQARGAADFLVELGGEVCARGRHPSGRSWQVAIENPDATLLTAHRLLKLENEALATSGDKINSYRVAGQRYGHIIDPKLGAPAVGGLASVSVIAPTAMLADAWATALYAAGPVSGPELAKREQLSALFLQRHGGGLREVMTGTFADRLMAR